MAKVEIQYENEVKTIEVKEGESILEAGLREGMDLPYSCMAGACTACAAQKIEGDIRMEDPDALDDGEIQSGRILTCCSYIDSGEAKIKYDD